MKRVQKDRPVEAEFEAFVRGTPRRRRRARACELGQHVSLDYKRLARYCLRALEPVDVDLLTVAGVVAFVDRSVMRRRATSWSRRLVVSIPVHQPERWSAASVSQALVDALNFLTGDTWEVSFVARPREDDALQLPLFSLPGSEIQVVLPYSGGLDSFAELRRVLATSPSARPFLVTTEHASMSRSQAHGTLQSLLNRCHHEGVPVELSPGPHTEASYRTRTFLFYSVAAVAWKLVEAESIAVPETGQGALGPSIVPYGNEQPYRSMHPMFTMQMRTLLDRLWGKAPRFDHPHLWTTKASVLRQLGERGLLDDYLQTRSCANHLRKKKLKGLPPHCGICAGCILRRSAIAVGLGLRAPVEAYVWKDLDASSLALALTKEFDISTNSNDCDIAFHGVLVHHEFAAAIPNGLGVKQTAFEVAKAIGLQQSDALGRVQNLVAQHRAEWMSFLDGLKPTSWVRQLVGGT